MSRTARQGDGLPATGLALRPSRVPPTPGRPRLGSWLRHSLGGRIVGLSLLLLLAIQAATFLATRASIDSNARASINKELEIGEKVLRRVLEQDTARREQATRLVGFDRSFTDVLASGRTEALRDALEGQRQRIHADFSALVDQGMGLLPTPATPSASMLKPYLDRLSAQSGNMRPVSEFAVLDGRAVQLVLVPLRRAEAPAWILMGFGLDLEEIHQLLSIHVIVQGRQGDKSPWKTAASTLPNGEEWVQDMSDRRGAVVSAARPEMAMAKKDTEYTVRPVLLQEAGGSAVSALLIRSFTDAVAPYRHLQMAMGLLTLLGVAAFAIGSTFMARHVTTPLRRLASAAERLGAGDYRTPLNGQRRRDEIGELADAFEAMRGNISRHQEEIRHLAFWDSLTGLPNRVQFRNALHAAMLLAKAQGHSVAVLMLDLNRFKQVNDVLGYRFGDLMLKGVAERLLHQAVRAPDLVARLAGDQFAILVAEVDRDGDKAFAQTLAARIDQVLSGSLMLEDHAVDVSASFGMAVWPHHADDADALLNRAEIAMYHAKRKGSGPTLYDPALDASSARSLSLLSELRHAVEHGELRLFLQPKFALDGAQIVGAEALMRWLHTKRGMVPPMEFIPFAEQTGFVRVLTLWIFEQAVQVWPRLRELGLDMTLSINLSTRDLLDADLPKKFEILLDRHRVPARALCLEITESAIMDDPERALATLERLSAMGFRLSIDDFGTGYSSLAYLKRLPVDELKIDKSFVLGMEKDLNDARIVRSTVELAHGLGLSVVAEGVENGQVWELLRELSCDEAQGFHMARPMPASDFERWASAWAQPPAPPGQDTPDAGVTIH